MGLSIFDRFGTKKSGLERDLVSKGNLPKHSRDFLDSQKIVKIKILTWLVGFGVVSRLIVALLGLPMKD